MGALSPQSKTMLARLGAIEAYLGTVRVTSDLLGVLGFGKTLGRLRVLRFLVHGLSWLQCRQKVGDIAASVLTASRIQQGVGTKFCFLRSSAASRCIQSVPQKMLRTHASLLVSTCAAYNFYLPVAHTLTRKETNFL